MRRADRSFIELLEAVPDAMVCVDIQGRIALVNAQAERMFGYGAGELIGENVEILVPDASRHHHQAYRQAYLADPSPRPMGAGLDLAVRRRDGTTFPAEISLSAVEADDGLLITAAVRDISELLDARAERARLERQLDQSRKHASLGRLAGEVAHDFNNLLAVIVGWTAIMSEELDEHAAADKERVRMQVDEIDQAARRAADLTRQLLTSARKCGRQAAHPVPR